MTYSIVARDPATGEVGVGVQSQAFNTGAAVPWARPGVGAVATQSFTDRRYGWRGLELMAEGLSPDAALAQLRSDDELIELRQVGMLAADGRSAQWTGSDCVADAGSSRGEDWIAQANMVASPRVWEALGETLAATSGSLAERLMSALEAAEAEGGDWRGRGGAAVLVVPGEGEPWERVVDLRVEAGEGSLVELRRLLTLALGYRAASRAEAGRAAVGVSHGLPAAHVQQLAIQDALALGDLEEAKRLYAALIAEQPRWRDAIRSVSTLPDFQGFRALLDE